MTQHAQNNTTHSELSQREMELAAIIDAYNGVTERLKISHEQLGQEVRRLRGELSRKNRQLRRRERLAALGELAAGVAPRDCNPLGGIQVFASLLRRDLPGSTTRCAGGQNHGWGDAARADRDRHSGIRPALRAADRVGGGVGAARGSRGPGDGQAAGRPSGC